MLKHKSRTDKIFVFTLDPVLGEDIRERLAADPRTDDCQIILPRGNEWPPQNPLKDEDLRPLLQETITGRLVILDVRRQTLPRIQQSYNRIMGYNRGDLNERVFCLAIGDGPANLFSPGSTLEVFRSLLAKTRLDYGASMFFFDPFIHYAHEEIVELGLIRGDSLPVKIPRRLASSFQEENADVEQVRRYFRGWGVDSASLAATKKRRQEKLARLYEKRLQKVYGDEAQQCQAMLGRKGMVLRDETLRMVVYPLHFEYWVSQLVGNARANS